MLSRFEKFICDITQIDLFWHRLAAGEMKRYGLKGNYAIYFVKLRDNPDGITSARLAAVCGKDKADVSRDLAVLEEAGLVYRARSGGNYRAPVFLTEQGSRLTDEIIRKAQIAVDCVGGELTEADRACFYRVLDAITANLQNLSQTGLPDNV